MVGGRLIAVCVGLMLVPAAAAQQPTAPAPVAPAPFRAPAGWRALPELAPKLEVPGMRGESAVYGDPALGVYAVALALHATSAPGGPPGDQPAVALEALRARLEASGVELASWQPSSTPQESASSMRYKMGKMTGVGVARARIGPLGTLSVAAFLCFHTPREPALAERQCDDVITSYSPWR